MDYQKAPNPAALRSSRRDRTTSLDAIHEVERLASAPGPGRPDDWRDDLLVAVEELGASIHGHRATSRSAGSLLSDLVGESPHLAPSVSELLDREQAVAERIDGLHIRLRDLTRPIRIDEIRDELAAITRELRDLRAWETDLVYEAYSVDLGVGD